MKENVFCKPDDCYYYGHNKMDGDNNVVARKCYYGEPMCWRGWMDLFIWIPRLWWMLRI